MMTQGDWTGLLASEYIRKTGGTLNRSLDFMSTETADRPGRWLSLTQAADRLGVAPRTVRRMVARGQLTGYRVGDTKLLRLDEVEVDGCMRAVPSASAGSAMP